MQRLVVAHAVGIVAVVAGGCGCRIAFARSTRWSYGLMFLAISRCNPPQFALTAKPTRDVFGCSVGIPQEQAFSPLGPSHGGPVSNLGCRSSRSLEWWRFSSCRMSRVSSTYTSLGACRAKRGPDGGFLCSSSPPCFPSVQPRRPRAPSSDARTVSIYVCLIYLNAECSTGFEMTDVAGGRDKKGKKKKKRKYARRELVEV